MSIHLSTFCSQNGIVLIALFPNATHLLQPLDVAVFKTLKSCWKEKVSTWKLENKASEVKRHNFAPILNEVLEERITPEILRNGFRKCGLLPWNSDAVAFEKTKNGAVSLSSVSQNFIPGKKDAMQTLEHYIGKNKVAIFSSCPGIWDGDIKDTSLYTVWKAMKDDKLSMVNSLENVNNSVSGSLPQESEIDSITENNVEEREAQNKTPVNDGTETHSIGDTLPNSESEQSRVVMVHSTPLQAAKLNILQPANFGDKSPVMLVSTPFKRALFWPEEKENTGAGLKRKNKKQKVPSVITSKIWQEFNTKKRLEKEKTEREKQERKLKREKAKEDKEKAAQNKKRFAKDSNSEETSEEEINYMESDDSPWNEEEEVGSEDIIHIDNKNQLKQGSFALVSFMGGKRLAQKFNYVCIVQDIASDELSVMALNSMDTAKKTFIANENDISYVKFNQVIGILNPPKIVSAGERVRYVFEKPVADINEK